MNCIPGSGTPRYRLAPPGGRRLLLLIAFIATGCATAATVPQPAPAPERVYAVEYHVTPRPARGTMRVEMRVTQPRRWLREVDMAMPATRFSNIRGDGEVRQEDGRVHWLPEREGGVLSWTVRVDHEREEGVYDARITADWAVLRASDIMPPARTRTVRGARSNTSLRFTLPDDWSVLTEYAPRGGVYRVRNGERRFDRPTGWILMGEIGQRIERIAGTRVLIGGPTGQDVRRMDMIAFLHWTLPQLKGVLPEFPRRLAVISASDGMWRGGLSAPRSLFVHADLPLISENATSTLLHELLHVGMGLSADDGADWIVEGLAEYYALELLRRSNGISRRRYDDALADLADWGKQARRLCRRSSTGATTARAVGVFVALNRELHDKVGTGEPLDELLRKLVAAGEPVTLTALRAAAADLAGGELRALRSRNLPGCD